MRMKRIIVFHIFIFAFIGCTVKQVSKFPVQGKEQYDQAIANYTRALEINPNDAEAYYKRGSAYMNKEFFDRAIYSNKEGSPIIVRSSIQFDRAISDFNKALEINPRYAEVYLNRGAAYAAKGFYDQAISDYNKALQINPRDNNAYCNRGLAHREKGEFDQAISDFNKALEINPMDAWAYYDKGGVCETIGRVREAVEAYKACIQYASPDFPTPYIKHARRMIKILGGLEGR